MKRIELYLLVLLSFVLSGCLCRAIEAGKVFLGTSTKNLEEARPTGVSRVFEVRRDACFEKVLKVLKDMDAHIHIKNTKRYIIVAMGFKTTSLTETENNLALEYDFIDTTEIGIFFDAIDEKRTEVTLASESRSLLEYISDKLFLLLYKEINS